METGYQRGKIQEESLLLRAQEARRLLPDHRREHLPQSARFGRGEQEIELARSTEDEKQSQLKRLADFQARNAGQADACIAKLKQAVIDNTNVFAVMMEAVRHCSLGQISNALYEVGGQYRRSM
jgi:methylmalonyl-CoA mutase